ncbi:MAG: AraC family ligand binding domain-containing protein, partial [Clostridia bacterium]|nr:AraC family ligand binding domain-containing protein [Clostridia bacterium]
MNTHYEYEPLFLKDELVRVSKFVCHNSYGRIHWHEPIEILFFTNGNAITACNFKEYSVKKGSILLINGNECHTGIISQENSTFYCIHFSPTFLHNLIGNEYVIFDNLIEDENCTKLLNLIVELSEKEKSTKNLLEIRKLSYEFFIILTNRYVKEISGEENYKKQFKKLDTFHNIINYLETHYFEDLQIEELAKI